jgi:phospholipase/lecithinase/hemolysin
MYSTATAVDHPELHTVHNSNVAELDNLAVDDSYFGDDLHPTTELRRDIG